MLIVICALENGIIIKYRINIASGGGAMM